jgi:hypothetical protein
LKPAKSVLKSVNVIGNVFVVTLPFASLEYASALLKIKLSSGAETVTLEHDF